MSSRSGTILAAWNSYRTKILPAVVHPIQLQECRRAFYAGGEMLMIAILRGLDPSPDAIQSDMDFIGALHDELHAFAADVKAGRA